MGTIKRGLGWVVAAALACLITAAPLLLADIVTIPGSSVPIPLTLALGGTGLTSAADDTTLVSSGTAWVASALPDSDGATQALRYDTTTNAFSAGTIITYYALQAAGGPATASYDPADSTTYYHGAPTRVANVNPDFTRVYIPATGTLRSCYVNVGVSGTLGTTEDSSLYFRLNNTTDVTISTAVKMSATSNTVNATGLTQAVSAGDYFNMKLVTPAWVTNPTNVGYSTVCYFSVP